MADYAIHDTTLVGTSNIIRKKEGSSALIDPADYPKRINLMGMLEEKTATGSIATFSDGADDVPLKSCEVALPASLDGYSSVDVVQTGKNLVNIPDSAEITRNQLNSNVVPLLNDFLNGKKGNFTISAKTAETVENANFITIRINYTDSTSSSSVYMYRGSTHTSGGITGSFSISSDPTKIIDSIYFGGNTGTAKCAVSEWQIEANSQATTYEPYVAPTTYTAVLGRTIYGGSVDVVKGTGTDENGDDFTFSPVEIRSRLGNNTMWSDEGDTEVTYRSSGTITPIPPALMSKTITANGIYFASDDGVDGYDTVAVNVPSVEPTVTPLNSPNAFLTLSSVTGTDVTRTVRTETAPSDGKYVFASDSTCRTNTGGGDGFIEIQKNGVSVVKQYMSANTTTDITIPNIEVEAGDEVAFIVGFDNNHSSCNFQLYTGIAFVSEASAPSLLSMSPSEEVNENTEEVEENEQNESEG